jgi:flagellar hook-associated protein 2
VKATAAAPTTANVTVTQGLASRLNTVLNKFLDPVKGRFKAINDGFAQQTESIGRDDRPPEHAARSQDRPAPEAVRRDGDRGEQLKGLQTQLSSLAAASTPSNR